MPPKKDHAPLFYHSDQEAARHLTDFSYEPPGMTASLFAEKIQITPQTFNKWISGDLHRQARSLMSPADLNALSLKGTAYSESRNERIKGHLDRIRHMGSKHSLRDYAKQKGLNPEKVRSWAEDDAYAELRKAVIGPTEGARLRKYPYVKPAADPHVQSQLAAEFSATSDRIADALGRNRRTTDRWMSMARAANTPTAGNTGNPLGDAPAGTLPADRERSRSPRPVGTAPSSYQRQRAENNNPQRKAPRPS